MGAEQFVEFGSGKTMQDAFEKVREQALWEFGHGGYSGTIAEKGSVREIKMKIPQAMIDARDGDLISAADDFAYYLMDIGIEDPSPNHWWDDKWGPCAGFHVKDDMYCFFGWASS